MWLIWVKDLVGTGAGDDVEGRDGIVMGFGSWKIGWDLDQDGFGMGLGLG